jgi:hypothetical protein
MVSLAAKGFHKNHQFHFGSSTLFVVQPRTGKSSFGQ